MWIKICGLTTPDAVAAAIDAGADAAGFVFTSSVRQLTIGQAVALAAPARGRVRCIAVMRRPSRELLDAVLTDFRPDAVQADVGDLASLRLPPALPVLPVLRVGEEVPEPLPERLLFEGPSSGAGIAADWGQAAGLARRTELVLAGGLSAENVAAAIARVHPFGVDVSSGVESSAGVKSAARIAGFIASARLAFSASRASHG